MSHGPMLTTPQSNVPEVMVSSNEVLELLITRFWLHLQLCFFDLSPGDSLSSGVM